MKTPLFSLKLIFSLILGIIGLIGLVLNYSCLFPPGEIPYILSEKVCKIYEAMTVYNEKLPFFLRFFFSLIQFAFLIFLFLSPLGIFLGIKSLKTHRKLAIFAIVLNSINLAFSLFIGWLVYGIAKYMYVNFKSYVKVFKNFNILETKEILDNLEIFYLLVFRLIFFSLYSSLGFCLV